MFNEISQGWDIGLTVFIHLFIMYIEPKGNFTQYFSVFAGD